jgi:hypothetical protein
VRGTRILRYVGNREKPEPEVYDPVERWVQRCAPISSQTFLGLDDAILSIIAKDIANPLFSDYHKDEGATIFTPNNPANEPGAIYYHWMNYPTPSLFRDRPKPKAKPEVDFEVNMMEALQGWKSWHFDSGILKSNSGYFLWRPDVPAEAKCESGCTKVPAEHHSCGIYGADSRQLAEEYGQVLGRVHGWGRYVRNTGGWKAQFAYPRCFYLRGDQMDLVDKLKQYHVPIYVQQPIQMYDPAEEGYDGYWNAEENGSSGASEIPSPGEAGDSGEDDED